MSCDRARTREFIYSKDVKILKHKVQIVSWSFDDVPIINMSFSIPFKMRLRYACQTLCPKIV